jgi:hypothetical protein
MSLPEGSMVVASWSLVLQLKVKPFTFYQQAQKRVGVLLPFAQGLQVAGYSDDSTRLLAEGTQLDWNP